MGKYTFSDIKHFIDYNKEGNKSGYRFPMLPKYNKTIGNLQQKQTHIISGMAGAGVSSFVDQNYIIGILLQWYNTEPEQRTPLKIYYYSMTTSEIKKLQLLLCSYIKVVYNLHVDIPTLNSQSGRIYDLDDKEAVVEAIEEATAFFNEIIDNEILVIEEGIKAPTDIYNDLTDYFNTIGTKTSKKEFEYNEDNIDILTLLVIDSIEDLGPDTDGFGTITGDALDDKLKRYITEMKSLYGLTSVLTVPSKVGYVRTAKDTEPHKRHLGTYLKLADKAICIYNPISEKNVKFYDADESIYTSPRGNILLRTWHIVRNVDGIDSTYERMFFLPGASYMVEYDKSNAVDDIDEVLSVIMEESEFYI